MKRWICALAALMAAPASAVTISNLDEVAHVVVLEEMQGSKVMRRVAPGETIRALAGVGTLYLRDKPKQKLHIEELDRLTIWGEGNVHIQMRRKNRGQ